MAGVAVLVVVAFVVLAQPGRPAAAGAASASPSPTIAGSPASHGPLVPPASPTPAKPVEVRAPTNGVLLSAANAKLARRRPLAVMIDDHPRARPQAGLAAADIVYQAPAEGGVPRYMLVFQVGDSKLVGPIRSARRYFVDWATEWRAMYAHVGGSPDALRRLRSINKKLVWDEDQYFWSDTSRYFWRSATRAMPHNVYATTRTLRDLGRRLGAKDNYDRASAWTFTSEAARGARPKGGSVVVPYLYNRITYRYDPASNRYVRGTQGVSTQRDAGTGQRIAPANVVVLYVRTTLRHNRPGEPTNDLKGRLDLQVTGSGKALVLRNGRVVSARWSKASAQAPTLLRYAAGCQAGKPVALVPGQIFIQVVPTGTRVSVRGQPTEKPDCAPTDSTQPHDVSGDTGAALLEGTTSNRADRRLIG